MTRSPNHNTIIPSAPDSNYADFRPEDDPEKYVHQDYAGGFVEVGRELQNGLAMNGAPSADIDTMFEPNSPVYAGAAELQLMADHIRANHRGESERLAYEQRFLGHMQLEASVLQVSAHIDFAALGTRAGATDPIDAERGNLIDILQNLRATRATLTAPAEIAEVNRKISALRKYRRYYLDDEATMQAHTDRTGGTGSMENDFVKANIAAENATGPRANQARFEAQQQTGRLRQFDRISKMRIEAYQVFHEYGYDKDPIQAPVAHPMEYKIEERPYAESEDEKKMREEMETVELNVLREEMAQFDIKTSRNKINGRTRQEVTEEYEHARDRDIKRKYGHIFNDPYVDPKMKNFVQAKALAEEWSVKRHEQDHALKDTKMAKICKWIGKHKLLVVGASALLAPMTFGTSVGLGLAFAGGAIAGAKIDEKMRGLKGINVSERTQELYAYMRDGNDYNAAAAYMDSISGKDIQREALRRSLAVPLGGLAVGGVGLHYFGTMPGAAEYLFNTHPYLKGTVYAGILASMVRNKGGGGHH